MQTKICGTRTTMLNLYYTLRRTTQTPLVEPVTHTGHTPHFPPLSYHFLHRPV